jgi:hypothetical protein
MKSRRLLLALALAGCGLVNGKTLSYPYAFNAQEFTQKLVADGSATTVPTMACDAAASPDPCAMLQQQPVPAGTPKLQCDGPSHACIAVADVRLPYPIDLSQQSLPGPVVTYGVDTVSIDKVAYWIMTNTVNVAMPPIDLYVASSAAKDENDPSAKLIGSLAMLAAKSVACADPADHDTTEPSMGAAVCDVKLSETGQAAMALFVKDYKTPFQLIAHTRIVAKGGDPLPVGTIDFFVRPTVSFSVLK